MRVGVLAVTMLLLVFGAALTSTACGGLSEASAPAVGQCSGRASLNDAGQGSCAVGRALVVCTLPSGAGCSCVSDDPKSCVGCGPSDGATCANKCAANEYAVSCGGPPFPGNVYQDPPSNCHSVGATPGGNVYSCCACDG